MIPLDLLRVQNGAAIQNSARMRLWADHSRVAVKRFGYLRDPLFVAACALYAVNRWLIKPQVDVSLFHNWFNDALLIPCALPVVLFLHRRFGLRPHDRPPGSGEIAAHLAGWALLFEFVGPLLMRHTTGDPWDVLAYVVGGLLSWMWWWRGSGHEL